MFGPCFLFYVSGVGYHKGLLWGLEETEMPEFILFSHCVSQWLQGENNNSCDDLVVSRLCKSKKFGRGHYVSVTILCLRDSVMINHLYIQGKRAEAWTQLLKPSPPCAEDQRPT